MSLPPTDFSPGDRIVTLAGPHREGGRVGTVLCSYYALYGSPDWWICTMDDNGRRHGWPKDWIAKVDDER